MDNKVNINYKIGCYSRNRATPQKQWVLFKKCIQIQNKMIKLRKKVYDEYSEVYNIYYHT